MKGRAGKTERDGQNTAAARSGSRHSTPAGIAYTAPGPASSWQFKEARFVAVSPGLVQDGLQARQIAQLQAQASGSPAARRLTRLQEALDNRPAPTGLGRARRAESSSPAGTAPIQRYVMQRATPTGWKYCSSFAQETLYDTEQEAHAADVRLARGDVSEWQHGERFPTLYTYTHTRPTSQIGTAPQGPHTVPHVLVDEAFGRLSHRDEFLMAFYEQVPSPDDVRAIILKEKGGKFGEIDTEVERFLYDYTAIYDSVETAIWNDQTSLKVIQQQLRQMLERNPYATYGWKSKTSASRRSLKGKGERKGKKFRDSVDSGGGWRDQSSYDKFVDQREMMVDGKYEIPQEELEYDGPLDGQYSTQEELVEGVLCGQEVVGNTIHLFPTGEWQIVAIQIISRVSDGVPINAKIRLQRRGG